MLKIDKKNIDLYDTITCGQIFRFMVEDNNYIIILFDRVLRIAEDNKYIYLYSSNEDDLENIFNNYFGLNIDYESINSMLMKNDNTLKTIIDECNGFKVIASPKLETIISYMISANNNVRNIQNSVNLMSKKCGKKVIFEDKEYYLFPTLDELKKLTLDDYRSFKLGFRSSNVYDFVQKITYSDINNINNMNTNDALEYLMSFKGIGLKIASCILLFGYQRFDVFPIDTWVKKYMLDIYGLNDIKKIEEFTRDKYKEYSGLVIQYMFHSKRNKR